MEKRRNRHYKIESNTVYHYSIDAYDDSYKCDHFQRRVEWNRSGCFQSIIFDQCHIFRDCFSKQEIPTKVKDVDTMEKWPQPKWFWGAIAGFSFGQYLPLIFMVLTGNGSPKVLVYTGFFIGVIIYPVFFIIVFFLLDRKVRKDLNTLFYLLLPLLGNLAFWSYIFER